MSRDFNSTSARETPTFHILQIDCFRPYWPTVRTPNFWLRRGLTAQLLLNHTGYVGKIVGRRRLPFRKELSFLKISLVEKANNISLWIEQGYTLFAEEGLEGIQIERLARILHLNKSGFYHYFADLEGYYEELIKLHDQKVSLFVHDVGQAKKLDPEYLCVLIKHAATVMFQVQLTRTKNRVSFYNASRAVDERVNLAVHPLWGDYLNVHSNSDVALRYFHLVRDMFYTRISFENLNYEFLHNLAAEAKQLMNHIGQYKAQFDSHE